MRLRSLFCLCLLSMGLPVLAASKQAYVDPLDAPSTQSALAVRSSLVGLAHAGQRLVTVGEMGHILFSEDGGGPLEPGFRAGQYGPGGGRLRR